MVPWELGFVVVISVLDDGEGERGAGENVWGPLDTSLDSGLKAFVASSVSLSLFYYQNIICIVLLYRSFFVARSPSF